ncbi:AfsR/SARP family transcriptional regulator [Nocardia pseudobrasiliensis]|nr:AfsR/SARP family transcriptional regulator [Nocardia pseudobrasiliensis]
MAPSAPKLRTVLGTLIMHSGQVVPASSLMSELWGDEPPASGSTTLQTYILTLRKNLAALTRWSVSDISNEILVTRTRGYLLKNVDIDYHNYNSLVSKGRKSITSGDDRHGAALLDQALRLWRGPALIDVEGKRVLESKRRQLDESRLVALELMTEAQIRLGMHREVLPELTALTLENPLHEGLHAQFMRALSLGGRRAQALEVFRQLRCNLIAELGIEPGKQVQQVHREILTSDVEPWGRYHLAGSR